MPYAPNLIPVTYIGTSSVTLREHPEAPYRDVDGLPRESLSLEPGEIIMMDELEALGGTYLASATNDTLPPIFLGTGIIVLPIHTSDPWQSLVNLRFPYGSASIPQDMYCYEFHLGRPDVIPINR